MGVDKFWMLIVMGVMAAYAVIMLFGLRASGKRNK